MFTEPADLDRSELAALLERHWGLRRPRLEYLPVGFGSHHWKAVDARGARRFVTVDDLEAGFQAGSDGDAAFAALERAYRTAALLRDEATLDFVVAPLFDDEGVVIRRLDDRYALCVLPYIDGESSKWGPYESRDDRRRMGAVLGRLHRATGDVPPDLPREDDFAIPSRAALVEGLDQLDAPWDSGPFAEPTRHLLRTSADDLLRRLQEYDDLVGRVRDSSGSRVITHGEPHRANVIRDAEGGVHLVDWDTTLLAPRERDLWMVLDDELTGWDEYKGVTDVASLNRDALLLYRTWWDLADIAVFVALLRRPHERTEDVVASWENLAAYLRA